MTSLKSFCNYLCNKWPVFIVLFSSHDGFFKPVNTVYKINFKICKFFVILIIFLLLRKSEVNLYLFLCQVLKRHSFSMNFLVLYWWVVLIIYLFEKEQNILINCSGAARAAEPHCYGHMGTYRCEKIWLWRHRTCVKRNILLLTTGFTTTQITTNNISGLLCRIRPLRFIEDQLSLKNKTEKNTSQNTSRKINGVLDTYLQETLGGREKPLQKKPARDGEKIEETWVGTKPKKLHDLPTKPKK